jgi:hypothetical protein
MTLNTNLCLASLPTHPFAIFRGSSPIDVLVVRVQKIFPLNRTLILTGVAEENLPLIIFRGIFYIEFIQVEE